jgi:glutathione S-transferase
MLKIWGRRNSINVQKVMWTVAELAIPHERIDAGMAFGLVDAPEYRARNPHGLVPVIEDDGIVVWESNAIVRYLAAKHADGTWMPGSNAGRARAEMWMDWQQTSLMTGLGPVFTGLVRTTPEKRDSAAIETARAKTESAMRALDHHLASRQFMGGTNLTVADLALGPPAYRWYALPIARPELPALRAWYERLAARPAFQQHVMLPLT